MITAGQLREKIKDLPDNAPVYVTFPGVMGRITERVDRAKIVGKELSMEVRS